MEKPFASEGVERAVKAVQDKKGIALTLLDLHGVASFTDFFLICTGTSARHIQAIANGIEEQLRHAGIFPLHIEGYNAAEWVLLDYVDFVVHIFSERARAYYDLERLWRSARRLPVPEEVPERGRGER